MASDNDDDSVFSITPMNLTESSALHKEAAMNFIESSEGMEILIESENEYDGFLWIRFPTFAKVDYSKGNFSFWIWKYGYKVQEIKSAHKY